MIREVRLYRYALELVRPVTARASGARIRTGLVVRLVAGSGHEGWGEVAPLPGFSLEDTAAAEVQLRSLAAGVRSGRVAASIDDIDTVGGIIQDAVPSVRFGVEAAVLMLRAEVRDVPIRSLLFAEARDSVAVNALVWGGESECCAQVERYVAEGYRAYKVKVGGRDPEEDIRIVRRVRALAGPAAILRLDANRAWDLTAARSFSQAVADVGVEYIEEPLRDPAPLLTGAGLAVPVALDETLVTFDPATLTAQSPIAALILKPTVLGLDRALDLAGRAATLGIRAVVTSSFESSLGLRVLAECAAGLNGAADIPMGLSTAAWFVRDLTAEPLLPRRGVIDLAACGRVRPQPDRLEEISGE